MTTTNIITFRCDAMERKQLNTMLGRKEFRAGSVVRLHPGGGRPGGTWCVWEKSRERNGFWLVPWDTAAHEWAKQHSTSCLDVESILMERVT